MSDERQQGSADDVVALTVESARSYARVLRRILAARVGAVGAVDAAILRDLIQELDPMIAVEEIPVTMIPMRGGANGDGAHHFLGASIESGTGAMNIIPISVAAPGPPVPARGRACSSTAPGAPHIGCALEVEHDGDHMASIGGLRWP